MADSGYYEMQSLGDAGTEKRSSMLDQFRFPMAKSFSFNIPEKFHTNNPFVVGWVDDLPGEVKREEPLEPAQFHAPKHALVKKFLSVSSLHNEPSLWLIFTRTPSTKPRMVALTITAANAQELALLQAAIPPWRSA